MKYNEIKEYKRIIKQTQIDIDKTSNCLEETCLKMYGFSR